MYGTIRLKVTESDIVIATKDTHAMKLSQKEKKLNSADQQI
jgi:hypothetical protein